ncbi:MAG TPA: HAMP domain-containing histidine kinase [Phycisphaerales bacterium]|nr:HAMP domain-containing histidine kinase [Phycisphaerales bacterium]
MTDQQINPRHLHPPGGLLGTMRIRKKLVVLHTIFSVILALILLTSLRPGAMAVVRRAEMSQARAALSMLITSDTLDALRLDGGFFDQTDGVDIRIGSPAQLGLTPEVVESASKTPGEPVRSAVLPDASSAAVLIDPDQNEFALATVRIPEARRAVLELYAFTVVAILAIYGLIAAALEMFVLPKHVYGPIARLLDADRAIQIGDTASEIIPDRFIPADEMGEIMRSRNQTVQSLRRHEHDLAEALGRFETVASDLKRKNHVLETARRNLADADRLASLGMMSAGIAHELNTPLAVIKGLTEKLDADPDHRLSPAEARLLRRVVGRLERLGESLLDFARVRPPQATTTNPRGLVDEAITLVRLDRGAKDISIRNEIPQELTIACDADRVIQVFVNLIRNAVDAQRNQPEGNIIIEASPLDREGARWLSISITDAGPGIKPELIESLFEPFVSTTLDSRGTGLGLAVADGIVREHGGVILAHNRSDTTGAIFEILLPITAPTAQHTPGDTLPHPPAEPTDV